MIYTRVLDRRVCSVRSPVDCQSGEPSAGSCLLIRQPWHFIPTGKAAPISTMPEAKRLKSRDLIASSWTTRHEITAEILDILRRRIQVRRSQPGHRSKGGEMIETIEIASAGSFGCPPEHLRGLSQFNYVFGSNGTGKSTVGRVIANPSVFPACRITWRGGTPLQVLVYNHDFVDRNFHQAAELKGVFTLGEKNVDTITKINEAKDAVDGLTNTIQDLTQTLQGTDGTGGKKGELTTLESGFKAKCWAPKQKHDQKFSAAFEGYRNNQEKFKTKVLQEASSNAQPVKDLAELEKRASSVFGATPTNEARVAAVDAVKILEYEANPILKKRVFGKEDVDIAAMIKKLGNSDWVRQGRSFYDANGSICPFCQQRTTDAFAASLSEYFDDTFVADSKAIEDLSADYATEAARLQQHIGTSIAQASRFLDVEKLKVEKEILDTRILLNNQRLNAKKREPSQVVELESLQNVLRGIKSLVDSANAQVDNHNTMVTNLADERTTLAAQVWRFIVEELKTELVAYKTAKTGLEKAMLNITEKIDKFSKEKSAKTTEIRELERQTTSIQPSIDGINALLCLFGLGAVPFGDSLTAN
jgi:wobble nucleotide-excising tRNase